MILINELYDLLIAQTRADKRGLSVSIDEFNLFIKVINERIYSGYYKKFEESNEISASLGKFKEFMEAVSLVSGVGSLPTDFKSLIGKPRYLSSGSYISVDLVSTLELIERQEDYLTQPTLTHPVCQLGGMDANDRLQINVYPNTIATVYVDYLRTPNIPFLDYYINDTTLESTYMLNAASVVIPSGYTYRDGTAGSGVAVASQTVDLEWDEEDLPMILAMLSQMVGLSLPSQELIEVGNAEELKNSN
jgi:hypothetical protein